MSLARYQLTTDDNGQTKLVVEGHDISAYVQRVTVDHRQGYPVPQVFVEGFGVGDIEGVGQFFERVEDSSSVVAFLQSVDPERLEREALETLGLESGGPASATEAILAKLMEYARGD